MALVLQALRRAAAPAAVAAAALFSNASRTPARAVDQLHQRDPKVDALRTSHPRKVGAAFDHGNDDPPGARVVRIAVTGGPCAGKSSSLAHLTKAATAAGFDVIAAPETPTLIFNSGLSFPDAAAPDFQQQLFTFQKALISLQLQMERSLTLIAASTGRPSIIVFDRGLLDPKGYIGEAEYRKVLEAVGIDEAQALARYDGVVHLVTAADGAPEFYKQGQVVDDAGNSVLRIESPEEARVLDAKMKTAWAGHAKQIIVPNGAGGFGAKLKVATDAVLEIALAMHHGDEDGQDAGDWRDSSREIGGPGGGRGVGCME